MIAKLEGTAKVRSLPQLRKYWACCRKVAENMERETPENIDFQVKVALKHLKSFKIIDGITYVELDSISFERLDSAEANNFFDRAFDYMAKMLGVRTNTLLENLND